MYHALLPVDRSPNRGINQARYVSRLAQSVEEIEATVLYVPPAAEIDEGDERDFASNDEAVEAATHLETRGIPVERTVVGGNVPDLIVRIAAQREAGEIVMGGRKRSGVTKVLLGSTVRDVMLAAERPVTIADETVVSEDGPRRLLVPVDRNEDRARKQAAYIASLPTDGPIEVTVLYVFPHQDYDGAPPHGFDEIDAAVETAESLEDQGHNVERVAIGGEVAETILGTAEELDVDGIVVGGRKRSGLSEVLLGSTVQDVVLSATRPVTITG